MVLKIFILLVIHKLLFLKQFIKDTLIFQWNIYSKLFKEHLYRGARVVATISRNGDLIYDCYIRFKFTGAGGTHSINNPGHALINNVELEIGGH